MTDYLYCSRKKNNPRVHHSVCEKNCNKYKKCTSYAKWYESTGGEVVEKVVAKKIIYRPRKKNKKKRAKVKVAKA